MGPDSIQTAVDQGMSSQNFDLNANVARGDTRGVDPAMRVMQTIMRERGCTFDEARNIYNQRKMIEAGIDPETGLSTDPKAVTSEAEFNRVMDQPAAGGGGGGGVAGLPEKWKQWWIKQAGFFGWGMLIFVFGANFCFGLVAEWYNLYVAYYFKDDLGMSASMSQTVFATASIALLLRPLCGAISDVYPIAGSSRHSYFLLMSIMAALLQLSMLAIESVWLTTVCVLPHARALTQYPLERARAEGSGQRAEGRQQSVSRW